MKSIIEQASSVIKAIEKAWNRAENPKDFSIKILEKEEKNFFGMTTKSAKVSIFFSDSTHKAVEKTTQKAPEKKAVPASAQPKSSSTPSQPQTKKQHVTSKKAAKEDDSIAIKKVAVEKLPSVDKETSEKEHIKPSNNKKQTSQKQSCVWNDSLIDAASQWIKTALTYMDCPVHFSTEISGKYLRITFDKPLFDDQKQNKQLFRSFAYLIIASLRNQFKQEVKDLKVVLLSPEQ